jgi:hypothetical protein
MPQSSSLLRLCCYVCLERPDLAVDASCTVLCCAVLRLHAVLVTTLLLLLLLLSPVVTASTEHSMVCNHSQNPVEVQLPA